MSKARLQVAGNRELQLSCACPQAAGAGAEMSGDFPPGGLELKLQVGCTFSPGDWGLEVHVVDELSPICPRWLVVGAADEQGLLVMRLQVGAAGGQYLPSGWLQAGAKAEWRSSTYFQMIF